MTSDESASERQRVTATLDQLTATLRPYVDEAMSAAYGTAWTERVANSDAARRKDGKRFPVSKDDLQVLLKLIQFERITPWGLRTESVRIGGYAAEIRLVRNLWAHGGSLENEHARLVDTIRRLLGTLDLPIPADLVTDEPYGQVASAGSGPLALSADGVVSSATRDAVQEAVDRLGETVRRPAQIFTAWVEGDAWVELGLPHDRSDIDAVLPALTRLRGAVAEVDEILEQSGEIGAGLPRVLALLAKAAQLGVDHEMRKAILVVALETVKNLKTLHDLDAKQREKLRARLGTIDEERDEGEIRACEDNELRLHELSWNVQQLESARRVDPSPAPLLDPQELRARAIARLKILRADAIRRLDWIDGQRDETFERAYVTIQPLMSAIDRVSADPSRLPAQAIRASARLPEGLALGHRALFYANFLLYALEQDEGDSALAPLRQAIAQQRMLIGLGPTADLKAESRLAWLLTVEGRLCNDLDRPDDAIRAFARADEIVDRYPLADPYLDIDALREGS